MLILTHLRHAYKVAHLNYRIRTTVNSNAFITTGWQQFCFYGSKSSGNSKFFRNRKIGKNPRRRALERYKCGKRKSSITPANITPVAIISSESHHLTIALIPINLFEGNHDDNEAFQEALAILALLRDNSRQVEQFMDGCKSVKNVASRLEKPPKRRMNHDFTEFEGHDEAMFLKDNKMLAPSNNVPMVSFTNDTSKDGKVFGLPENIENDLRGIPLSGMELNFEMDMTNVRDALLNPSQIAKQPPKSLKKLQDLTLALSTNVQMDPKGTKTIPLHFSALIHGTVAVNPKDFSKNKLESLRVPEFNEYVTAIAANVCSTALQKGFPTNVSRMFYSTGNTTDTNKPSTFGTPGEASVEDVTKLMERFDNKELSAASESGVGKIDETLNQILERYDQFRNELKAREDLVQTQSSEPSEDEIVDKLLKKYDQVTTDLDESEASKPPENLSELAAVGYSGTEKKAGNPVTQSEDDACTNSPNVISKRASSSSCETKGPCKKPSAAKAKEPKKAISGCGSKTDSTKDPCKKSGSKGCGAKTASKSKCGSATKDPCKKSKDCGAKKTDDPCKSESKSKCGSAAKDPCKKSSSGCGAKKNDNPCKSASKSGCGPKKSDSGSSGCGAKKADNPCKSASKSGCGPKKTDSGSKGCGAKKTENPCKSESKSKCGSAAKDPCKKSSSGSGGCGAKKADNPCKSASKSGCGPKKTDSGSKGCGAKKTESPCKSASKSGCGPKKTDSGSKGCGAKKADNPCKSASKSKCGSAAKDPCKKSSSGSGGCGAKKNDNPCKTESKSKCGSGPKTPCKKSSSSGCGAKTAAKPKCGAKKSRSASKDCGASKKSESKCSSAAKDPCKRSSSGCGAKKNDNPCKSDSKSKCGAKKSDSGCKASSSGSNDCKSKKFSTESKPCASKKLDSASIAPSRSKTSSCKDSSSKSKCGSSDSKSSAASKCGPTKSSASKCGSKADSKTSCKPGAKPPEKGPCKSKPDSKASSCKSSASKCGSSSSASSKDSCKKSASKCGSTSSASSKDSCKKSASKCGSTSSAASKDSCKKSAASKCGSSKPSETKDPCKKSSKCGSKPSTCGSEKKSKCGSDDPSKACKRAAKAKCGSGQKSSDDFCKKSSESKSSGQKFKCGRPPTGSIKPKCPKKGGGKGACGAPKKFHSLATMSVSSGSSVPLSVPSRSFSDKKCKKPSRGKKKSDGGLSRELCKKYARKENPYKKKRPAPKRKNCYPEDDADVCADTPCARLAKQNRKKKGTKENRYSGAIDKALYTVKSDRLPLLRNPSLSVCRQYLPSSSISTNRAVIEAPYKVCTKTENIANILDNEVLIKVDCVALSDSDLHTFETGGRNYPGITLGNEAAGVVKEVGCNVANIKPGDHVAIEAGIPCGVCDLCKIGHYNLCSEMCFTGGLSKYCTHPAAFCHKIDKEVPLEHAALACQMASGCNACHQAGIKPDSNVVIIGSCTMTVCAAICAKLMGAGNVCVMCTLYETLEIVKNCVTDKADCFNSSTNEKGIVRSILAQLGTHPDIIINCASCTQTMNASVMALKPAGTCVVSGFLAECASFNMLDILMKEICICPSFRSRNMFPLAIKLLESGRAPMDSVLAHCCGWNEMEGAFNSALSESNNGPRKVIVQCQVESCDETG